MLTTTLAFLLMTPKTAPMISIQEGVKQEEKKSPFPETPRTLNSEDYMLWERLGRGDMSGDGEWLAASVSLPEADGYTVLRKVSGGATRIPSAVTSQFSDDSRWFGVMIQPEKGEREKLTAAKKPVPIALEYWRLGGEDKKTIENVGTFRFSKGSKFLMVSRRPVAPGGVGDLQIVDLTSGVTETILNVASFTPNEDGSLVALVVESSTGEKGVRILELATMSVKTLIWGKEEFATLDWADEGNGLVVAMGIDEEKKEGRTHKILYYSDAKNGTVSSTFEPKDQAGFGMDWRVAESGGLSLSEDGKAVFFGAQEWKDKKKPSAPDKDKAGVEIWNTADLMPIPQQKRQAGRTRFQVMNYAWFPAENRVVKITDDLDERALITGDSNFVVVVDTMKYATAKTDGVGFADIDVVDLSTGMRSNLLTRTPEFSVAPSDTGRYAANYRDKHWWVVDLQTKKWTKLVGRGVTFEDKLDDSPAKIKSPGGRLTWLRDDQGFVVEDRYDVWAGTPGKAELTRMSDFGRRNMSVRYRQIADLDGKAPQVGDRHYFSIQDETNKSTGMGASDGVGPIRELMMSSDRIAGVRKAKKADRMMMIRQSWTISPRVEVSDATLTNPKVMVSTNDHQSKYKWGSASLVQYKSKWGVPLQGALMTPADYDPSKKYPMVLYIYERVSDGVNIYEQPSDRDAYNAQVLSQNGYFVLMADIAYRTNDPGVSAVECLEPAVDAALAANKSIDPKKVGLIGHSWGAYQTAFVTTVSKKFAVGACGAPLTEMTAMYNSFYWNAGITNQIIFEQSQGRFDAPFWDIPEKYIQNSPVWRSKERTVPILVAFGDQDGAVDWSQGQFLFNTLRRMGKKSVLLVYAGENHGLAQKGNQLDYARRLRHYLDVYLKGTPAEDWVEKGVSFSDQSGG